MTAYMVIMLTFALLAVLSARKKPDRLMWALAFIVLVVFVGLRHKVGMDWNNYLVMISRVKDVPVLDALTAAEPGYALLLWLSNSAGWGIYGANLVGAIVLLLGVFRFSSRTQLPWMSLVVAMPFLIVVVGMSANRQAMAIGILLWLVASWQEYSIRKRAGFTLLAASFHFSAIFFLLFLVLDLKVRAIYKLGLASVMIATMLAFLQISGGAGYYDGMYLSGQSQVTYSPGAIVHVLLNGIPAALVMLRRPYRQVMFPTVLSIQLAWLAMALIPLAVLFSGAAGRMTLYLFPVSMFALSALPSMMASPIQRAAIRTILACLLTAILWAWLEYSNSSFAHIPYENVIWMDSRDLHIW